MSTHTAAERYLERDDTRLHWRLEGRGPPIALLHGWALDLQYWDPAAALLARRFTVLRFDRRGFGRSSGVPDVLRNSGDLQALLDAAAIDRVVLLGMSQGARLAIHFALAFPARVRGLILDGAPALEAELELPVDGYRQCLATEGPAALQSAVLAHPLMQLCSADAAAHRLLREVVARYSGLDLLQTRPRLQSPELAAISAPTLILNGSDDSDARRQAGRALQAAIPGAVHQDLRGSGHLAQLDDPSGYAAAVADFCADLPP